jgi:GNAT superfamily N-acetyltransferase
MNIRIARPDDARAIAEVLSNIDDYPHWREKGVDALEIDARASLEARNQQRLVWVAELEGRVIGYAAVYWLQTLFQKPEGYISELFIRSDASGRGVGTALLETIKKEARAKGCGRLTLVNLKDRESYKRHFYEKKGWTERPDTVRFVLDLEVHA